MPTHEPPVLRLRSFADAHILRAYLSQANYPESWQRRMILDLDAAIDEATRPPFPRAPRGALTHPSRNGR